MSSGGSVSNWIRGVKSGEAAALERLWQRYFPQLVRLAGDHLRHLPCRVKDADDVVAEALTAFWQGASGGQYAQLQDRTDLWRLLFAITVHKARDLHDYLHAACRGSGKVRGESAFTTPERPTGGIETAAVDPEPTPAAAAQLLDDYHHLLDLLGEPELQTVARLKMAGHTNEEIAQQTGCKLRSVERRLGTIRRLWAEAVDP
jgi:DNA-directed RNA polymerase specialized sigma24 family protein